jgi:hypothetical protein
MKTNFKFILLPIILLIFMVSCIDSVIIEGNGELVEESRVLPAFTEINSSGIYNVYYRYGEETGVKIVGESNLLPYIETAVFDKRLEIRTAVHVGILTHKPIDVYVTSPSVSKILLTGSGKIYADSINEPSFAYELNGSGKMEAGVWCNKFYTNVTGSGSIDLTVLCDTAYVEVTGSGRIDMTTGACKYAKLYINGTGIIELEGSSEIAHFENSGSGQIKAYNFQISDLVANISGSGNVYCNVISQLDANLTGSGTLYYLGQPEIKYNILGSGGIVNGN